MGSADAMVQRIGGSRRKTRYKLQKEQRKKGKVNIRQALKDYSEGDRVSLAANSTVHKGMHPARYNGLTGVIKRRQGACYVVEVLDGSKKKEFVVHPAHLEG